jgi:hypothetical protein
VFKSNDVIVLKQEMPLGERARVGSQTVRKMKKLKNEDSSHGVQAFVTMQGVLVVQSEKGQQERRVFESASP